MIFSKIRTWPEPEKERLYRFILLGVLAAIALWTTRHFLDAPRPWLDEGIYLQAARHLAETGRFGLTAEPGRDIPLTFITVGFPVIAPVALAFKAFGISFVVGRSVALLFLVWCAGAGSLLMRRLYGRRAGLWAVILLATFSPFYGHGKNLLGEVPGLVYLFSSLWLLCAWDEQGSKAKRRPLLFGILFGLAVTTKPSFLVLLPALALAVVLRRNRSQIRARELIVAGMASVVVFAVWVWTQFGRTNFTAVLGHYANPYGLSDMASVALANARGFITHATPLHFLTLAVLVVSGFALRGTKRIRLVEWLLLGFIALTWVSYFRTAGWYRYFFLAHVPLLLLMPAMAHALAARFFPSRRWAASLVCIAFLIANLFALSRDANPMYGTSWRLMADKIGSSDFPADTLYLTAPEMAFFHPTESFRQYIHVTDVKQFGTEALDRAMADPPAALVVGTPTPEIEPLLKRFIHVADFGSYGYWERAETGKRK